jgi:hypothetical protein
MPVLLLHSNAYPIELVVEVLVSVIYPGPDLLLYITEPRVSSTRRIVPEKSRRSTNLWDSFRRGYTKQSRQNKKGGLQEASGEHEIRWDENVVEEV